MSFVDRVIAKQPRQIRRVVTRDAKRRLVHYYIYVPRHKEMAFKKALRSKRRLKPEEFGTLIASDLGRKPSDETRMMLWKKYRFFG